MNPKFAEYLKLIEQEIDKALPSTPDSSWCQLSFGNLNSAVNNSHLEPLIQPTNQLVKLGGKRWRPLLLTLCAIGCNKDSLQNALHLTPLVEFVHTASLIHDDIEDNSTSRRGQPAAYLTFGTDVAINAGAWLYFEAAACINNSQLDSQTKLQLYKLYTEELRRLHLGQAMDIKWHRQKDFIPLPEQYLAMVKCKTGTLSSLAAKIGAGVGGMEPEKIQKLGLSASEIGAGFQIIDDVINLSTGNPGKKRGDDIMEGKKSLIVINFAKNNPDKVLVLEKLFTQAALEGIDSPAVEKAITLLESSGEISKARIQGADFINRGCLGFRELIPDSEISALITELFTSML